MNIIKNKFYSPPLVLKIARLIVPFAIFFFLGKVIVTQWSLLEDYKWSINIPYMVCSFFSLLFAFLLWAILFQRIFFKLEANLSLKKTFKVLYISNLGRYIPGKVWQLVAMYYLLERENIGKLKTTSGIIWSNIFTNLSAILIGVSAIALSKYEISLYSITFLLGLFAAIFLVIQPPVIDALINYILKKLKRTQIKVSLSLFTIVSFIFFYAIVWGLCGSAFFLLTKSVAEIDIKLLPLFIGFFASSYVVGYIALFAPGGLGVREGVLAYMLSYYVPLPVASLIAVVSRIWLTLGELACVGIAWKIK